MFDILSTAELTVSASIAVAFLSLAMAQTVGRRVAVLVALGAWFALVLAIGATGALSPAGGGAPALGLAVALPVAALVSASCATTGCAHAPSKHVAAPPPYVATTLASAGTIAPSEQLAGVVAPYQNVAIQSSLTEPADEQTLS